MDSSPESVDSQCGETDTRSGTTHVGRRRALAGIAGACLVSLSGCVLFQNEIQKSASPAELDEQTREQTSFEHQGTEELTLTQTVQVAGESRDLNLTNYLATYRRTVPEAESAVASVQAFSTPSVTVGGNEANPLWDVESKRLLRQVATGGQMTGFQEVREVGTREISVLGAAREFTILEGTTERQGQEIAVRLPTGKFKHDGDIIVLLGGYPAMLGGAEQINTAFGGIVHPA